MRLQYSRWELKGEGDTKWLSARYVLKVEPMGFPEEQMWVIRKRRESRMTEIWG